MEIKGNCEFGVAGREEQSRYGHRQVVEKCSASIRKKKVLRLRVIRFRTETTNNIILKTYLMYRLLRLDQIKKDMSIKLIEYDSF